MGGGVNSEDCRHRAKRGLPIHEENQSIPRCREPIRQIMALFWIVDALAIPDRGVPIKKIKEEESSFLSIWEPS